MKKKLMMSSMLIILITTFAYSQTNLICGKTQTLQAEDATLFNAVVASYYSGYSGSGYVNFANETGSYLEWSVYAECPGNAECTVLYANGARKNRPMEIKVNDAVITTVNFSPTGSWTSWSRTQITLSLTPGINTIRMTSIESYGGPNVDKMDITVIWTSLGDVNADGNINILDSLLTAQYYVGLDPERFYPNQADVNCNSFIDIVDALLTAQYYVGLIDSFPCEMDPPSHTYFHKNIMITVKHTDDIGCDDFTNMLKYRFLVNWDVLSREIARIKQMIACQDIAKRGAINKAATFIENNWSAIQNKIECEIVKIFDQNRRDCQYFCFRQDNKYTTYVFLDVHDLFHDQDFAFYVFVLALQSRAGICQDTPQNRYIEHINPDWLLTVHNMIVGSPGGKAVEPADEKSAYQFLIEAENKISSANIFLDTEVGNQTERVHVYILDTLPRIYDSSPEDMTSDEIADINNVIDTLKKKIERMLRTDPNQPAKTLKDNLLPLGEGNELFKRIGSFPTGDYCCQQHTCCKNCNADILEYSDSDYNTPIPDHGIFIAGLINSLAPNATIEILQTLNSSGVGSMKSFLCALHYIHKTMDYSKKNIINCSFGLKCSFMGPETDYEEMVADPDAVYKTAVAPLETLMNLFSNTTIIASTGNHDGDESTYPAALDLEHVIRVGSLGIKGIKGFAGSNSPLYERASYSNTTKKTMYEYATNSTKVVSKGFYAPGGMISNPGTDYINRETSDKKGLFGLYLGDEVTEDPDPPVYGYWSGTSFAAPLVAGVFANLYRKYNRADVWGFLGDIEDKLEDKNPEDDEFFELDLRNEIIAVPIIQQHMYDNKDVIIH